MRLPLITVLLLFAGTLSAQIDTRIYPVPPSTQPSNASDDTSKWNGTPLTGFLSESLGSSLKQGTEASLTLSETANNQSQNPGNNGTYAVDEDSRITGTLSFHRDWSRSSLLFQYAGGTDQYVRNSFLDTEFHQLAMSEAMKLARWTLSLNQQFFYLPESNFGFNPAYALGNGIAGAGSSPGTDLLLPLNVIERTISSGVAAKYALSARTNISFNGAFSDLHFSGAAIGTPLFDSQISSAGAQYTYALNSRNSIGAEYSFSLGRAMGLPSLMQSHSALATYTRTIGDRLTLQAAVGPQFTSVNQFGNELNLGAAVSVNANASYQLGRTSFAGSYFRGTNAGTGLFLGSQSNDVRGSVSRQLSRTINSSMAVGYSRNKNLGLASLGALQQINSSYVSASIEKSIGSRVSGFLSYSFNHQDVTGGACSVAACTPYPAGQSGTVGFRFHIHPFTLQP